VRRSRRSWRPRPDPDDDIIDGRDALTVVVVAHVDTGPLWYQWIARAGHHAWLWYVTDGVGGAERLVRETSPDVLLVDATTTSDPGWKHVQELRQRFAHAKLPVVLIGPSQDEALPHVHVVGPIESADALLQAVKAAARANGQKPDAQRPH
jgi:CheY-like chemotaxis protein